VLEAARVAKGCLYGHFESKEALSYAVTDFLLQKLSERREATIGREKTARAKLYALLDTHRDPLNSFFNGGCPILNLSTEADDTNPVIKEKIQLTIQSVTRLYSGIIRAGVKAGEFSKEIDPDVFAVKMFAAIEGGNMICRTMNHNKYMLSIIKSLKDELETYSLNP
jgi:TetR/AcrR family transcriptional repressor of nem operon